ncbi:MAG: TM2 domain-containing protein [Pontimonas sp.]
MTTWTVKEPGNSCELTTEELTMRALARKIVGTTTVVDANGETWMAKQIPGVFSRREWLVALLLSVFVGVFGIDRFYLGKVGTGILKLLTFGGFTIWSIIDIVLIAIKRLDDKEGHPLA